MAAAAAAALAASYARVVELAGATVTGAWVHPLPGGALRVVTKRATKDIVGNKARPVLQSFVVDAGAGTATASAPAPLDAAVVAYVPSPSGRYALVLRKDAGGSDKDKPASIAEVLHVDSGAVLRTVRADADVHGDVVADAWWGEPAWSPDERYVAYVAEAKAAESLSFFAPPPPPRAPGAPPPPPRGRGFDFDTGVARESWGERYDAVRTPRLFVVDIAGGRVVPVPGIPDGVSAGQPSWAPLLPPRTPGVAGGAVPPARRRVLAYTGWHTSPRRLGIVYCFNRRCGVFAVDVTDALALAPPAPSASGAAAAAPSGGGDSPAVGAAAAPALPTAPLRHVLLTPDDVVARCGRFVAPIAPPAAGAVGAAPPAAAAVAAGGGGGGGGLAALRLVYLAASGPSLSTHDGPVELKAAAFGAWWAAGGSTATTESTAPEPERVAGEAAAAAAAAAATSGGPAVATAAKGAAGGGWAAFECAAGLATRVVVGSVAEPGVSPGPAMQPAAVAAATGDAGGAPFPSLFAHALLPQAVTPDGRALFVSAQVGTRAAVLRLDVGGTAAGGGSGAIVDESAHGLAALPPWAAPAACGARRGGSAAAFAASVEAACRGAVSLLAACPLPASGPSAVALLLSASAPNCPERLTLLVTGLEPAGWFSLTERRTTMAVRLPPSALAAAVAAGGGGGGDAAAAAASDADVFGPLWAPAGDAADDALAAALAATAAALRSVAWRLIRVNPVVAPPRAESAGLLPSPVAPFHAIVLYPSPSPATAPGAAAAAPVAATATASGVAASLPLVVVPHGGPHTAFDTAFLAPYAWLASATGRAVLLVNYRGSTGYGAAAAASLPGRIGAQDVDDTYAAAVTALALGGVAAADVPTPLVWPTAVDVAPQAPLPVRLDAARVSVVGGSHGGFLGAHLAGRHPELFAVAALRNPVTNVAAMCTTTDIPDWCWVEALGVGAYDFGGNPPPTPAALVAMAAVSPIRHLVPAAAGTAPALRAPVLLLLGLKDKRVPASQGIEFLHSARAAGVTARALAYPEDNHAIDKPASEADAWVNIAQWLSEHGA